MPILTQCVYLLLLLLTQVVHGPGHWNDPDMLLIGNFGLSFGQSQTQMALWSIMAAPLIMSVDLRTIQPWAKDILQNKNLIAINQDRLGAMGGKFNCVNNIDMWSKALDKDMTAFAFVNTNDQGMPTKLNVKLVDLGLTRYPAYNLYETFSGALIGKYANTESFEVTVNPSGSVFAFWAEPSTNKHKPRLFSQLF